jgi:hypothetical protein
MRLSAIVPAIVATGLLFVAGASTAQAFHRHRDCCEPSCCAPEPSCGAEASCCDPCDDCCRPGLLARLKAKLHSCCHRDCCEPSCCAPEPSCGCGSK